MRKPEPPLTREDLIAFGNDMRKDMNQIVGEIVGDTLELINKHFYT